MSKQNDLVTSIVSILANCDSSREKTFTVRRQQNNTHEALKQRILYRDTQFIHIQLKNFFSFIFISWRLITLQYCSGFCHTLTWISHGFTCAPHPDPPPASAPPHPIALGCTGKTQEFYTQPNCHPSIKTTEKYFSILKNPENKICLNLLEDKLQPNK